MSYVTGTHALKVGFTVDHGEGSEFNNGDLNDNLRLITLNGSPVTAEFFGNPLQERNLLNPDLGIYAQDQWTLDRLTVNAGVRFDYFRNGYPDHLIQPGQWVKVVRDFPGETVVTWKDLQPRLGVVYDLFGDGRTAIKASANRYADKAGVGNALALNPARSNNSVARVWLDGAFGICIPPVPCIPGSSTASPAAWRTGTWAGFTPLLFAAREDAVESARVLLAAGANVNDTAPTGASALVIAAHSGRGNVAALLLEHRALPDTHGAGYTALHTAVLRDDIGLVRALLANGANPNVRLTKGTPVKYLSQEYALSSTLKGATPFWLAAKYVEAEMMRVLAGAGADIELPIESGTTPLMAAIDNPSFLSGITDRRGRVLSTVETAALVDSEGERGTLEAVQTLVELGADVNATSRGSTALHIAASAGHVPAMQVLTTAGADVNAADGRGSTPLHNAASQGHDAAVQLLADQGANLEAEAKNGQTPLAMTSTKVNPSLAAYMTAKDRTSTAALLRALGATR